MSAETSGVELAKESLIKTIFGLTEAIESASEATS